MVSVSPSTSSARSSLSKRLAPRHSRSEQVLSLEQEAKIKVDMLKRLVEGVSLPRHDPIFFVAAGRRAARGLGPAVFRHKRRHSAVVFPLAFGLLGIIALFGFVPFVVRMMAQKQGRSRVSFDLSVLSIRVPKAKSTKEDVEQKSTQQVKVGFGGGWRLRHGRRHPVGKGASAVGSHGPKEPVLVRARVAPGQEISFYIAVPSSFGISSKSRSTAPVFHARSGMSPTNVFPSDGVVMASYLKFKRQRLPG